MSTNSSSLPFIAGCALILSITGYALPVFAQTGTKPISRSVGTPAKTETPMDSYFGLEAGYGLDNAQGTFLCDCGSRYSGGDGKGFSASAFYEKQLSRDFTLGLKLGLEYKNTTSSDTDNEVVFALPPGQAGADTVTMPIRRDGVLKMYLLRFAPYIQYEVLHTLLFIQIGPGISYLLHSRLTQTRNIINDTVRLANGTVIPNFTFTNGTSSQVFEDEAVPNTQSLLFSAIGSAGIELGIDRLVISPMVTYELPLSNIQSTSNVKISSIYGCVGVKFRL